MWHVDERNRELFIVEDQSRSPGNNLRTHCSASTNIHEDIPSHTLFSVDILNIGFLTQNISLHVPDFFFFEKVYLRTRFLYIFFIRIPLGTGASWGMWSECSVTCDGVGTRMRNLVCPDSASDSCDSSQIDSESCDTGFLCREYQYLQLTCNSRA